MEVYAYTAVMRAMIADDVHVFGDGSRAFVKAFGGRTEMAEYLARSVSL